MDLRDDLVALGQGQVDEVYRNRREWRRDQQDLPDEAIHGTKAGIQSPAWKREVARLRKEMGTEMPDDPQPEPTKRRSPLEVAADLLKSPPRSLRINPKHRKPLRKALVTISQRADALIHSPQLATEGMRPVLEDIQSAARDEGVYVPQRVIRAVLETALEDV